MNAINQALFEKYKSYISCATGDVTKTLGNDKLHLRANEEKYKTAIIFILATKMFDYLKLLLVLRFLFAAHHSVEQ